MMLRELLKTQGRKSSGTPDSFRVVVRRRSRKCQLWLKRHGLLDGQVRLLSHVDFKIRNIKAVSEGRYAYWHVRHTVQIVSDG